MANDNKKMVEKITSRDVDFANGTPTSSKMPTLRIIPASRAA